MKQLNALVIILSVFFSSIALANTSKIDLAATMKNMKFELSEAYKTESKKEFKLHIDKFSALLATAKRYPYSPERKEVSLQGLNKVAAVVEGINRDLETKPLADVKSQLRAIDDLRKEYHKKNKPSIWQSLFS